MALALQSQDQAISRLNHQMRYTRLGVTALVSQEVWEPHSTALDITSRIYIRSLQNRHCKVLASGVGRRTLTITSSQTTESSMLLEIEASPHTLTSPAYTDPNASSSGRLFRIL